MELLPPNIRRLLCERYPHRLENAKVPAKLFFPRAGTRSTSPKEKTSVIT